MSLNIICPLPKEYDTPSEKVRKIGGYLDDTIQALVSTTDTFFKEVNTDMVDKEGKLKQNIVEEAITPPISTENKIDTVNKTSKSQASNKTVDTLKSNKIDTVKSLDKSSSTQRTDIENTVDKPRSIPRSNYSTH